MQFTTPQKIGIAIFVVLMVALVSFGVWLIRRDDNNGTSTIPAVGNNVGIGSGLGAGTGTGTDIDLGTGTDDGTDTDTNTSNGATYKFLGYGECRNSSGGVGRTIVASSAATPSECRAMCNTKEGCAGYTSKSISDTVKGMCNIIMYTPKRLSNENWSARQAAAKGIQTGCHIRTDIAEVPS
jgi:hypothetical protein